MTEIAKSIAHLNDGLKAMRDDVESRLAAIFEALAEATELAEHVKSDESQHDTQLAELLDEVRERDLEIGKLTSELDSKKDLVTALRRQIGEIGQLKAAATARDQTILEQQNELERKQQELDRVRTRLSGLEAELAAFTDRGSEATSVDNVELVALKSELDARKSMIKSLKADAQRAESLEAQLDAKREAIDALEQAVDQHARTIAGLRESVDAWKAKYRAVKGEKIDDGTETMTELPAFTDTELEALKALEESNAEAPDATVAIDMRDALKEARRHKATF